MGMMLLVVEVTAMTVVMAAVTMLMAIAGGHGNMGGLVVALTMVTMVMVIVEMLVMVLVAVLK